MSRLGCGRHFPDSDTLRRSGIGHEALPRARPLVGSMLVNRRHSEAAERFAERRRREDEAPRLRTRVPSLVSLRLEVEERRPASPAVDSRHVRHIVDSAPALFVIPCGDPACKNGGHDVTDAILRGLAAGSARFEVEDVCAGDIGTAQCGRVLKVTAIATYR